MNLKQLHYIIAIAECQNISRAAEQLYISRSALNESLLQLEEELGVPLFIREGKKLTATFAGECYIETAKSVLNSFVQLKNTVEGVKDTSVGKIQVGTCRTIGEEILNAVIPKFHQKYPGYQLDITVNEKIDEMVQRGEVSWAIAGYGPALPLSNELENIPLSVHETVLVLPNSHPLAKQPGPCTHPLPALDLKLFKNDKFILLRNNFNARGIANQHFSRAGFTPKVLIECNSGLMASQFVKAGLGPSILLELLVRNDSHVSFYSLEPKAYWTACICYRKGCTFSKVEQYLINLIQEYSAFSKSTTLGDYHTGNE